MTYNGLVLILLCNTDETKEGARKNNKTPESNPNKRLKKRHCFTAFAIVSVEQVAICSDTILVVVK